MKYPIIKTPDNTDSHILCPTGNYVSLCGLDGNDYDPMVDQKMDGFDNVVTCYDCIKIWDMAMTVPKSDLSR